MARRYRDLNKEDVAIWRQFAETVNPLAKEVSHCDNFHNAYAEKKMRFSVMKKPLLTKNPLQTQDRKNPVETYRALRDKDAKASPNSTLQTSLAMDYKTYKRMRQGKMSPAARLDLHGKTISCARQAVGNFILKSYYNEQRLILIICGKGKRTPAFVHFFDDERKTIRTVFPQWLRTQAMRPYVLEFLPAHPNHGGEGAYYVYLRCKNKSKIQL